MRLLLPVILSACAVAEGAAPRPVGMSWNTAAVDCGEDGLSRAPMVSGAFVQAAACNIDGVCWSTPWGEDAGDWTASCGRGVVVVEWTWITPIR